MYCKVQVPFRRSAACAGRPTRQHSLLPPWPAAAHAQAVLTSLGASVGFLASSALMSSLISARSSPSACSPRSTPYRLSASCACARGPRLGTRRARQPSAGRSHLELLQGRLVLCSRCLLASRGSLRLGRRSARSCAHPHPHGRHHRRSCLSPGRLGCSLVCVGCARAWPLPVHSACWCRAAELTAASRGWARMPVQRSRSRALSCGRLLQTEVLCVRSSLAQEESAASAARAERW